MRNIVVGNVRNPYWTAVKVAAIVVAFAYVGSQGWLEHWQSWALLTIGFGIRHLLAER